MHSPVATVIACVLAALTSRGLAASSSDECSACDRLAAAFAEGVVRTSRHNFGGGNTAWEEKKLGSYAFSETRLVDITERLCKSEGKASLCHSLLERFEEDIERWWFGEFKANQKAGDLRDFLCVNQSLLCCHAGRFGPDCRACPERDGRVCSGRGSCNGNGTRGGTGACDCHKGYTGELCTDCSGDHYAKGADCLPCHPSCRDKCSGPANTDCAACGAGYTADASGGCVDIDECSRSPCGESSFCRNTAGSFVCSRCDQACAACDGPTAADCRGCAPGFEPSTTDATCVDINECSPDTLNCRGLHERCVNLPGSFHCDCQPGYERRDGGCVKAVKQKKKKRQQQQQQQNKQKKGAKGKPKIIWTVAYTIEFAKFFGAIVGLCVFSVVLKGSLVPVLAASGLVGAFLYSQSFVLDKVYLNGRR